MIILSHTALNLAGRSCGAEIIHRFSTVTLPHSPIFYANQKAGFITIYIF